MSHKELKIKNVGAQILREISEQVYGDLYKQIRELVSNAVDAGATEFRINVSADFTTIVFEDNGIGMNAQDIEKHYVSLAVSEQGDNPDTIGRKGVGKFALLGISKRFVMETRKQETDGSLSDTICRVSFSFDEACEMENSGISLSNFTVGSLTERTAPIDDTRSFTKITCKNIEPPVSKVLGEADSYNDVIRKLRRVLPLRYDPEHPVLKRIDPSVKEKMLRTKVPIIDVYIKSPHDPEGQGRKLTRLLWGEDEREQPMKDKPLEFSFNVGEDITVYGYIIATIAKIPDFWNGFVVRVKNVAVEEGTFFGYSDTPVLNRLTGEVNIDGIDDLTSITMDRSRFNRNHGDFREIQRKMQGLLKDVGKVVRGRSNIHGKFKRASTFCQGFQDAKSSIQNAYNAIVNEKLSESSYAGEFANSDEERLVDEFDVRTGGVRLVEIREEPQIDDFVMHTSADEVRVAVPTKILDTATYLGTLDKDEIDLWKYRFLGGSPTDPPCLIDADSKEILLNTRHNAVKVGDSESVRIIVLLTVSYLKYGTDAKLMYEKLLKLLTFDQPAPTSFDI